MIMRRYCHIYDGVAWARHIKTLSDYFSRLMRVYKTLYVFGEGSINTTSTYRAVVRLTSIANRPIRRDPRTEGGGARCGQSGEQLSQLAHHTSVFYQNQSGDDCVQLAGTALSVDRWLITAPPPPLWFKSPSPCAKVPSHGIGNRYRWPPSCQSYHSHQIEAVGVQSQRPRAVTGRVFFCRPARKHRKLLRLCSDIH